MSTLVDIVLIEDNEADMELAVHALRHFNLAHRLQHLHDGEEALDYLFCRARFRDRLWNTVPRLVLLDLKLPKVDGLEVLREVKADPRTKHIPVVVLTSSREERDLTEAYRLGVNSYIQKPVEFGQFKNLVGQVGSYWLSLNQTPVSKFGQSQEESTNAECSSISKNPDRGGL
jgi:two-component system, response regulator